MANRKHRAAVRRGSSGEGQDRLTSLGPAVRSRCRLARAYSEPRRSCRSLSEENKAIAGLVDAVTRLRREREESRARNAGQRPREVSPFTWVRNGLRHSFCSYRLAEVKDAARVALEAGNSPGMLFRHYRELVSEDAAKAWFNTVPIPAN